MSKYGLDKALWTCVRTPTALARLDSDPDGYLRDFDLSDAERSAIESRDVRALYEAGAIPFLIYQFAVHVAGGFTFELAGTYVAALQGVEPQDIST